VTIQPLLTYSESGRLSALVDPPSGGSQDIAIVTLGGGDVDQTTATIVDTAVSAGVQRIITINAGGIDDELPEPFNFWDLRQLGALDGVLRRAADVVEQSPVRYTVIRPVWQTGDTTPT
jgi:hypothetical protein